MKRALWFFFLLAGVACSRNTTTNSAPAQATPAPALANPIHFPLYANSKVLTAHSFTQLIDTKAMQGGIFSQGTGTYAGNEVIATTGATLQQLRDWLSGLRKKAPPGYSNVDASQYGNVQQSIAKDGIDFSVFQRGSGKDTAGLIVIAMEPQRVTKTLGPALGLIAKYRSLPGFMRDRIDSQVKEQTGFSITEATQPESPLGMALNALDQLQHTKDRAIVMAEAQKQ